MVAKASGVVKGMGYGGKGLPYGRGRGGYGGYASAY